MMFQLDNKYLANYVRLLCLSKIVFTQSPFNGPHESFHTLQIGMKKSSSMGANVHETSFW